MNDLSPTFSRPPVVELVLGVQFAPIKGFNSSHSGWYWRDRLATQWPRTTDAPLLPDHLETFDSRDWDTPVFRLHIGEVAGAPRLQIHNQSGDRQIQLQPTRFHYNWRKGEASYPRYRVVLGEFLSAFRDFRSFIREAGLGELTPNHWELIYVNEIPKGDLWESPADWHNIFPALFSSQAGVPGLTFAHQAAEWVFEIPPRRGRLQITAQQKSVARGTSLFVHTTARGPTTPQIALEAGLQLAHDITTSTFLAITSDRAQAHWGRVN